VSDPLGLRFGTVAEDYELGRAGWPPGVVEGVEGDVVLDLAAGTGKLTRLLVTRFPRVLAIEPLAGMRAVLERVVPEAESIDGTAEAIPLPEASVDAAFVAEAFHWFDAAAAARELARVIRPGGMLRLVFNVWRGPFRPSLGPGARELLAQIDHEDVANRERVVAHLVSTSSAGALPEQDRRTIAEALREAIREDEYRVEIDTHLYEARRL
jgi:ubiquinone/menaquinone biosynthesis C-methylase UbiE